MGNTISSKEETIKIPDPFHPIHKIDKLLNILNKSGEQISQFIGYTTVEQLFYIYLLKKYKNHCLLFDSATYLNITINLKKNPIKTICIEKNPVQKNIIEEIKEKKEIQEIDDEFHFIVSEDIQ